MPRVSAIETIPEKKKISDLIRNVNGSRVREYIGQRCEIYFISPEDKAFDRPKKVT